jgi:hypothetical protein
LDEILDRQKKLEEQVTSFLLTPGNSDDLLEDLVPKPINSEQEFDRFEMELQKEDGKAHCMKNCAYIYNNAA